MPFACVGEKELVFFFFSYLVHKERWGRKLTAATKFIIATARSRGRGLPKHKVQAVKVLVSLDQASTELLGSLFAQGLARRLGGFRGLFIHNDYGKSGDGRSGSAASAKAPSALIADELATAFCVC